MQSAEIMSGAATTARGWELDVIAAVIIGGTSLMGGEGQIRGTLIGVVFLGILVNGMTLDEHQRVLATRGAGSVDSECGTNQPSASKVGDHRSRRVSCSRLLSHQTISTPQKPNIGKKRSISAGTIAGSLP